MAMQPCEKWMTAQSLLLHVRTIMPTLLTSEEVAELDGMKERISELNQTTRQRYYQEARSVTRVELVSRS